MVESVFKTNMVYIYLFFSKEKLWVKMKLKFF